MSEPLTDYAVFALGECYYNGIGTAVNKQLAKEWFQKQQMLV